MIYKKKKPVVANRGTANTSLTYLRCSESPAKEQSPTKGIASGCKNRSPRNDKGYGEDSNLQRKSNHQRRGLLQAAKTAALAMTRVMVKTTISSERAITNEGDCFRLQKPQPSQ